MDLGYEHFKAADNFEFITGIPVIINPPIGGYNLSTRDRIKCYKFYKFYNSQGDARRVLCDFWGLTWDKGD